MYWNAHLILHMHISAKEQIIQLHQTFKDYWLKLRQIQNPTLRKKITLISFISAGTLAMLRSEQNDTNTKIAATLVCNLRGIKV